MQNQKLTIDQLYTYEVTDILAGGMGYVLLLSRISSAHKPSLMEEIYQQSSNLAAQFRYPYRPNLAAKTVKEAELMPLFARECNIWLGFEQSGIVPLLKVVDVNDMILALMPHFSGSLRDLLLQREVSRTDILRALIEPVAGLAEIHKRHEVVHQDIKPENFLYQREDGQLKLVVSDWGIANVQASQLRSSNSELSQFALSTMRGFGTVPYMAPERFCSYISNVQGDIFSLGIMMIEILVGSLPYAADQPIEQQILSGSYYEQARLLLSGLPPQISNSILGMVHPATGTRTSGYGAVLKFLRRL
jgi:serine/threonine protein kinase